MMATLRDVPAHVCICFWKHPPCQTSLCVLQLNTQSLPNIACLHVRTMHAPPGKLTAPKSIWGFSTGGPGVCRTGCLGFFVAPQKKTVFPDWVMMLFCRIENKCHHLWVYVFTIQCMGGNPCQLNMVIMHHHLILAHTHTHPSILNKHTHTKHKEKKQGKTQKYNENNKKNKDKKGQKKTRKEKNKEKKIRGTSRHMEGHPHEPLGQGALKGTKLRGAFLSCMALELIKSKVF